MAWLFSFILAHQGDAADPELLHWIKERLDQFGTGPWVVVAVMGFVIASIPLFVIVVYFMQANRRAAAAPPKKDVVDQDVPERERVP